MPIDIVIRTNAGPFLGGIDRLKGVYLPQAIPPAVNAGLRETRKLGVRRTAKQMKVIQKPIRKRTRFTKRGRAKRRLPRGYLTLYITPLPVRLLESGRRKLEQGPLGVSLKGGAAGVWRHAFIAHTRQGMRTVFRRKTKRRKPIEEVRIPLRPLVLPNMQKALYREGAAVFRERFRQGAAKAFRKKARFLNALSITN